MEERGLMEEWGDGGMGGWRNRGVMEEWEDVGMGDGGTGEGM